MFKEFLQLRFLKKLAYIVGFLLILVIIFQGGIFVGYNRSFHSYNRADRINLGLNDPRSILAPFFRDSDQINSHGAIGEIVSISFPTILIKGRNSGEEVIALTPTTTIRSITGNASSSELKAGTEIVVIGEPDGQGRLQAAFIRLLPKYPPIPAGTSTNTQVNLKR